VSDQLHAPADLDREYYFRYPLNVGQGSLACIATRELDDPGIESRWRRDFRHPPSHLFNTKWESFKGVKRHESSVGRTPTSSADVKEKVQLYLYFFLRCAFVACCRVNCIFTLPAEHEAVWAMEQGRTI